MDSTFPYWPRYYVHRLSGMFKIEGCVIGLQVKDGSTIDHRVCLNLSTCKCNWLYLYFLHGMMQQYYEWFIREVEAPTFSGEFDP